MSNFFTRLFTADESNTASAPSPDKPLIEGFVRRSEYNSNVWYGGCRYADAEKRERMYPRSDVISEEMGLSLLSAKFIAWKHARRARRERDKPKPKKPDNFSVGTPK